LVVFIDLLAGSPAWPVNGLPADCRRMSAIQVKMREAKLLIYYAGVRREISNA
jgi:hypothetical protein